MKRAGLTILLLMAPVAFDAGWAAAQNGVMLAGQVVLEATRTPLGGAAAVIEQHDFTTRSASDGSFRLGPLPPGAYVLRVAAAHCETARFNFVVPQGATGVLSVGEVVLARAPLGTATLNGAVLDVLTKRPVPGATVHLDGTLADVADSAGSFQLADVPWGAHRMEVVHLGYRPTGVDLAVDPSDPPVDIAVALLPLPVELAGMEISADAYTIVPRLRAFHARRERGYGHFVTREEIDRQDPVAVSELLRRVPGLRVAPGHGSDPSRIELVTKQSLLFPCEGPLIFIDGVKLTEGQALDDIISPRQIEAVEVYTRASQVPAEFNHPGAGCGVIVIWGRSPTKSADEQ